MQQKDGPVTFMDAPGPTRPRVPVPPLTFRRPSERLTTPARAYGNGWSCSLFIVTENVTNLKIRGVTAGLSLPLHQHPLYTISHQRIYPVESDDTPPYF